MYLALDMDILQKGPVWKMDFVFTGTKKSSNIKKREIQSIRLSLLYIWVHVILMKEAFDLVWKWDAR